MTKSTASAQAASRTLQLPARPTHHIFRPRLVDEFDEACAAEATCLLNAPAGWGKTTLVAEWLHSTNRPAAWLTLDVGHNSPDRLWDSLRCAFDSLGARLRSEATELDHAQRVTAIQAAAMQVDQSALQRSCLVLDDCHAVTDAEARDYLRAVVEGSVGHLRLVLMTRAQQGLRLERLVASGSVVRFGPPQLRFTDSEAAELLRKVDPSLTASDIGALCRVAKGWPAGVFLASLVYRDAAAGGRRSAVPDGTEGPLADYVVAEILDAQPPEIRAFLQATSILPELHPRLCDAVTGRPGSARILERLERDHLFVERGGPDQPALRYHPLFANVLRSELRSGAPELEQLLHGRAAEWRTANGDPIEALDHAEHSGDPACLSRTVVANYTDLLKLGETATLRRVIEQGLGPEGVSENGHLTLARALALMADGEFASAERWLNTVAKASPSDGPFAGYLPSIPAALHLLEAQLSYYRGDLQAAEKSYGLALDSWPDEAPPQCYLAQFIRAGVQLRMDRPADALTLLATDESWARETNNRWLLLHVHPLTAAALLALGAEAPARQHLDAFTTLATVDERNRLPASALPAVVEGWFHLRASQLDDALTSAQTAVRLARAGNDRLCLMDALRLRALIADASGDRQGSRGALAEADELEGWCVDPGNNLIGTWAARLSQAKPCSLTRKQHEVIVLLAEGLTNAEIAERLFVSERTIHSHLRSIYRQLRVNNRTAAVRAALDTGLI